MVLLLNPRTLSSTLTLTVTITLLWMDTGGDGRGSSGRPRQAPGTMVGVSVLGRGLGLGLGCGGVEREDVATRRKEVAEMWPQEGRRSIGGAVYTHCTFVAEGPAFSANAQGVPKGPLVKKQRVRHRWAAGGRQGRLLYVILCLACSTTSYESMIDLPLRLNLTLGGYQTHSPFPLTPSTLSKGFLST